MEGHEREVDWQKGGYRMESAAPFATGPVACPRRPVASWAPVRRANAVEAHEAQGRVSNPLREARRSLRVFRRATMKQRNDIGRGENGPLRFPYHNVKVSHNLSGQLVG